MIHILQLRALAWRFFIFKLKILSLAFVTLVVLGYGFPATTNSIFRWNDAQIERLQDALLPQVAYGDKIQKYEKVKRIGSDVLRRLVLGPVAHQNRPQAEAALRIFTAKGGLLFTELWAGYLALFSLISAFQFWWHTRHWKRNRERLEINFDHRRESKF